MKYNTDEIIKILVRNKYLSPLNGVLFSKRAELLKVNEVSVISLKENLAISLESNVISKRNIRDFTALLNAIEDIKDENIMSINIIDNSQNRTIYVDQALKTTFDEI